jgi:hypothetical protein
VETYILNSSGYPSKKYIQSSTGDYTDSISMTYDSDGYILSSSTISFGYTSKYTFTWSNGNLISKQDSTGLNFERYTYYTDKINTVGNENKGMFFLGMKSKNLVKNYSGSIGGSIDHSYEFDTRNRVKKETAIGANTNISTYTYY